MPAFFINAKTQHENLGDAVITRQLIALARDHGPVAVQISGTPSHFLNTIDLKGGEAISTSSKFLLSMLKAVFLRRLGAQPFSGGVVYLLNPGGFEGEYSFLQAFRHIGLVAVYMVLRLLGVRLMRVGCSLGPFGPRRLVVERFKSRLLSRFSARDPISIQYAHANGLGLPIYFPDLAFLLPPPVTQKSVGTQPVIAISFRQPADDSAYDAKVETILQVVVSTAPQDTRYLVVTQVGGDQHRNGQLAQALGIAERSELVDVAHDLLAAESTYRRCDVVLSNRLHVLLLALRQGANIIAVVDRSKNRKIVGILELIGLGNCIWDVNGPTGVGFEDALHADKANGQRAFEAQRHQATDLFAQWVNTP